MWVLRGFCCFPAKSQLISSPLKSGLVSSGGTCPCSFYLARIVSQSCPLESRIKCGKSCWVDLSLARSSNSSHWRKTLRGWWIYERILLASMKGTFTCDRVMSDHWNYCSTSVGTLKVLTHLKSQYMDPRLGFNWWQWW